MLDWGGIQTDTYRKLGQKYSTHEDDDDDDYADNEDILTRATDFCLGRPPMAPRRGPNFLWIMANPPPPLQIVMPKNHAVVTR